MDCGGGGYVFRLAGAEFRDVLFHGSPTDGCPVIQVQDARYGFPIRDIGTIVGVRIGGEEGVSEMFFRVGADIEGDVVGREEGSVLGGFVEGTGGHV